VSETSPAKAAPPPWIKLVLDIGPLIVFFATFQFFGIFRATAVFMVAVIAALAVSYFREGRVSPMPVFSAVLVVFFGGLTLYFKNDVFIKLKFTVIYVILGTMLIGGLAFNRLFIKYAFGEAFDLSETGWRKLTWRWGGFFLGIAVLNEIVWRTFATSIWMDFKFWAVTPLIFLFALAQMPLVLKHDISGEKEGDAKH
jgi:intracellular septation protein